MNVQGEFRQTQVSVTEIHQNTSQTLIETTEDKLRLALLDHLAKVESRNRWHVPLGVLAGLVPVFLTSDFKQVANISKDSWQGAFLVLLVMNIGWLIWTIKDATKSVSVEELVERIKKGRGNA